MRVAGIIAEYNPLHPGHIRLMEEVRRRLGPDTAIVCAMSGNFVQRGDFALTEKRVRAAAAVRSGADLVLEIPLPWAVSSAESFADGGIQVLLGTGVVTDLAFGSECGDAAVLSRLAAALLSEDFPPRLRAELKEGDSFAAARQRAVAPLVPPGEAEWLRRPNSLLAVEYCKALLRREADLRPLAVLREGDGHDAALSGLGPPSSSAIRELIREGQTERALRLCAPAMAEGYRQEERAGRAPVWMETCERGILARLRLMTPTDYVALDPGREGLSSRMYRAGQEARSLEEFLERSKTRRYARSRLRRMVLWSYLRLTPARMPETVPYLRLLAAGPVGRRLLGQMRTCARLPVLTRGGAVRNLPEEAQRLFALENRGGNLYALAYPVLAAARGGQEWRAGPRML